MSTRQMEHILLATFMYFSFCEKTLSGDVTISGRESVVAYSNATKTAYALDFVLPKTLVKDSRFNFFGVQGDEQTWVSFSLFFPGENLTDSSLQQRLEAYAKLATWKDKITEIKRTRFHGFYLISQNKAFEHMSKYETTALLFLDKTIIVKISISSPNKNIDTLLNEISNSLESANLRKINCSSIGELSHIIELDPQNESAFFSRANLYYKNKEYEQAIQDCGQVIKLNRDYADAFELRGYCYYEAKQYAKAIQDFSKFIKLKPDDSGTYYGRAMTYQQMKQYENAIQDFSQAIKLNPGKASAYYGRGYNYILMKQYNKAIHDYAFLLELNPKEIDGYLTMVELLLITDKSDQAEVWLQKMDKNIASTELSKEFLIIKLYFSLICKYQRNESVVALEKQLNELLAEKINTDWIFDAIEEWLNAPKHGLTKLQIDKIRTLTGKIKQVQETK